MLKKTVQKLEIDLKREAMLKNADKWVPDVAIGTHTEDDKVYLDIYPVYRTW